MCAEKNNTLLIIILSIFFVVCFAAAIVCIGIEEGFDSDSIDWLIVSIVIVAVAGIIGGVLGHASR